MEDVLRLEPAFRQCVLIPLNIFPYLTQKISGPVISFRVFNKRIVVLNDYRSVEALLDNRATIYSDRPMSWMYNVICGRGNAIFNISASNPRHKAYRRLLSQGLGTRGTKLAWPILQNEVDTLLDGLSNAPDDWEQHLLRYVILCCGLRNNRNAHVFKHPEPQLELS